MSTAGVLAPSLIQQFFNQAATAPGTGYLLFTYIAGTTTPQATYTDATLAVANPNPLTLNSAGQAEVWLNPALSAYKFVYSPPNDTNPPTSPIFTVDNVVPYLTLQSGQSTVGQILYPQTPAEIANNITPSNYNFPGGN